jgi:hypothetical protein
MPNLLDLLGAGRVLCDVKAAIVDSSTRRFEVWEEPEMLDTTCELASKKRAVDSLRTEDITSNRLDTWGGKSDGVASRIGSERVDTTIVAEGAGV